MARAVEFDEMQAVQKAMEVFWQNGYAATSMRDLTEAMQINSSSLYNTLGDKRQLFIKALQHYTASRRQAFEQYRHPAESPLQTLTRFMHEAAHGITMAPSSCMCVRTAFELEGTDADIQAVLTAYEEFMHHFLRNLLVEAQHAGEIAPGEDAGMLAYYLNSLFAGWYKAFLLHRDRHKIEQLAAYVIRQLQR